MAGLTATSGTGTQTTTQSPQASAGAGSTTAQSSGVQPGTATSLLNGQGSVALHTTALSTVSLDGASQQTVASPTNTPAVKHQHVNAVLIGLAAVLLLAAVVYSFVFSRQVKSTTI